MVDPPGSGSTDFGEVARGVEARCARAGEAPEEAVRELFANNPSWAEEDARGEVAGHRDCAAAVAAMVRGGLRYDLAAEVAALKVPTLLVLGSEGKGSALSEPERSAVAGALHRDAGDAVGTLETGHNVDAGDFGGFVGLLDGWLQGPKP